MVGILKDLFPGLWHFSAITVQGKKDTKFTHPLGRVPDMFELADGGLLGPGTATPVAGTATDIPPDVSQPEGGADWYVLEVTDTYYIIRKWTSGNVTLAATLMLRQGLVNVKETP